MGVMILRSIRQTENPETFIFLSVLESNLPLVDLKSKIISVADMRPVMVSIC